GQPSHFSIVNNDHELAQSSASISDHHSDSLSCRCVSFDLTRNQCREFLIIDPPLNLLNSQSSILFGYVSVNGRVPGDYEDDELEEEEEEESGRSCKEFLIEEDDGNGNVGRSRIQFVDRDPGNSILPRITSRSPTPDLRTESKFTYSNSPYIRRFEWSPQYSSPQVDVNALQRIYSPQTDSQSKLQVHQDLKADESTRRLQTQPRFLSVVGQDTLQEVRRPSSDNIHFAVNHSLAKEDQKQTSPVTAFSGSLSSVPFSTFQPLEQDLLASNSVATGQTFSNSPHLVVSTGPILVRTSRDCDTYSTTSCTPSLSSTSQIVTSQRLSPVLISSRIHPAPKFGNSLSNGNLSLSTDGANITRSDEDQSPVFGRNSFVIKQASD
ncbi:unnamed protein product, partial [Protopolystoma xenopodis]